MFRNLLSRSRRELCLRTAYLLRQSRFVVLSDIFMLFWFLQKVSISMGALASNAASGKVPKVDEEQALEPLTGRVISSALCAMCHVHVFHFHARIRKTTMLSPCFLWTRAACTETDDHGWPRAHGSQQEVPKTFPRRRRHRDAQQFKATDTWLSGSPDRHKRRSCDEPSIAKHSQAAPCTRILVTVCCSIVAALLQHCCSNVAAMSPSALLSCTCSASGPSKDFKRLLTPMSRV